MTSLQCPVALTCLFPFFQSGPAVLFVSFTTPSLAAVPSVSFTVLLRGDSFLSIRNTPRWLFLLFLLQHSPGRNFFCVLHDTIPGGCSFCFFYSTPPERFLFEHSQHSPVAVSWIFLTTILTGQFCITPASQRYRKGRLHPASQRRWDPDCSGRKHRYTARSLQV